jgi:uncharacterized protein (DUF2141 family)
MPDALEFAVVNVINPICGQASGSISLQVSGGTPSYSFSLNGVASNTGSFNNLAAGSYAIIVTDANGCDFDTTITLNGGPGFTINTNSTDVNCFSDCNGTASVQAGGNSSYTFVWSNGATTSSIDNLCAGTYSVTVTDANGCDVSSSVTVNEPAPLDFTVSNTTDITNNLLGTATLVASGGTTPYTYDIANVVNPAMYSNQNGFFTGLTQGLYTAQVTDANGCTIDCAKTFKIKDRNNGQFNNYQNQGQSTFNLLSVNPNPMTNFAQITYQMESQKSISLTIIDASGKVLLSKVGLSPTGTSEINVENFVNGSYFVIARGDKGQVISTERFIVSK